ncbi:MotA/TolQ/ExbB proton channel family protein [Rickettsiales bacterium]|nr:MotA/TolQ/ExbB proton channel family protein [Rickettsiales bacterium]
MMHLIDKIGFLFYPLSFLSIVAITIIIERFIYFLSFFKKSDKKIEVELLNLLEKNQKLDKNIRDEIISFKLIDLKNSLESGVNFLRMIAILAPMIGLLGTVTGIIKAFKVISLQTSAIAPSMIADALWNAMLTTAYGLIIAIPALFFVFFFLRIAEKYIDKLQKILNEKSLKISGFND